MMRRRRSSTAMLAVLLASGLLASSLAACLSSAPPAPPVRWFDPSSTAAVAARLAPPVLLQVVGAPHLRREFAVRVGERELVYDPDHAWLQPPATLVANALQRLGAQAVDRAETVVTVDAFELARVPAPQARVRLVLADRVDADRGDAGRYAVVDVSAPAASDTPVALVDAMAEALEQAAQQALARLSR